MKKTNKNYYAIRFRSTATASHVVARERLARRQLRGIREQKSEECSAHAKVREEAFARSADLSSL